MADNKIYEEIIFRINNLLKQDDLYPAYTEAISSGKNKFTVSQVFNKRNYSSDWIDILEDCIVALDTIVRNPRKFIVIEEDIVDISLARSISVESVKHLSQHTNLISNVDKRTGMVVPSKILNTSKEESFEIYENRFIYTLLLKLKDFIESRFNAIKNALMQSGELGVDISSEFSIDGNKVCYKLTSNANFPFENVLQSKTKGTPTNLERVVRIKNIINDFLSSPFAKEMCSCALVRPPITRTNVILKDPNFKKALVLWQYIETNEKMDYKIEVSTEESELSPSLADKYRGLIFLNTVLMQSIAATKKFGDTAESAKEREKLLADEYVTKNIDDFVPDDFPLLKMDLKEIRRIYTRLPSENDVTSAEVSKINGALDRVLRQVRINKIHKNNETRKKLIAKQLEDEAKAKQLAIREEQELERRKRHAAARMRLEAKRLEKETAERLARLAEEERILAEKAELQRKKEEAERLRREKLINEETSFMNDLIAKAEAEAKKASELCSAAENKRNAAQKEFDDAVKAFKEEQEALKSQREALSREKAAAEIKIAAAEEKKLSDERIAKELNDAAIRIKKEQQLTISDLTCQNEKFWEDFYNAVYQLGLKNTFSDIHNSEKEEIRKIRNSEKKTKERLDMIKFIFGEGLAAERAEDFSAILNLCRQNRSPESIERILSDYEKEIRKRRKEIRKRKIKLLFSKKK